MFCKANFVRHLSPGWEKVRLNSFLWPVWFQTAAFRFENHLCLYVYAAPWPLDGRVLMLHKQGQSPKRSAFSFQSSVTICLPLMFSTWWISEGPYSPRPWARLAGASHRMFVNVLPSRFTILLFLFFSSLPFDQYSYSIAFTLLIVSKPESLRS